MNSSGVGGKYELIQPCVFNSHLLIIQSAFFECVNNDSYDATITSGGVIGLYTISGGSEKGSATNESEQSNIWGVNSIVKVFVKGEFDKALFDIHSMQIDFK